MDTTSDDRSGSWPSLVGVGCMYDSPHPEHLLKTDLACITLSNGVYSKKTKVPILTKKRIRT